MATLSVDYQRENTSVKRLTPAPWFGAGEFGSKDENVIKRKQERP